MDSVDIFPVLSPQFLSDLRALNNDDPKVVAEEFRALAQGMEKGREVLQIIVDCVAFYPLKPTVMEEELCRIGLTPSLSSLLSKAWAELARMVVGSRKKLLPSHNVIEHQVMKRLPGAEESVILNIDEGGEAGRKLTLRLEPDQLFKLFEELEEVQGNIDKICQ